MDVVAQKIESTSKRAGNKSEEVEEWRAKLPKREAVEE